MGPDSSTPQSASLHAGSVRAVDHASRAERIIPRPICMLRGSRANASASDGPKRHRSVEIPVGHQSVPSDTRQRRHDGSRADHEAAPDRPAPNAIATTTAHPAAAAPIATGSGHVRFTPERVQPAMRPPTPNDRVRVRNSSDIAWLLALEAHPDHGAQRQRQSNAEGRGEEHLQGTAATQFRGTGEFREPEQDRYENRTLLGKHRCETKEDDAAQTWQTRFVRPAGQGARGLSP